MAGTTSRTIEKYRMRINEVKAWLGRNSDYNSIDEIIPRSPIVEEKKSINQRKTPPASTIGERKENIPPEPPTKEKKENSIDEFLNSIFGD